MPMSPAEAALRKKRILNPDGTFSSERTITIGVDGVFYNIPTIWKGIQLNKRQAIDRARLTGFKGYKSFGTIKEAVKAAGERSDALGEADRLLRKLRKK